MKKFNFVLFLAALLIISTPAKSQIDFLDLGEDVEAETPAENADETKTMETANITEEKVEPKSEDSKDSEAIIAQPTEEVKNTPASSNDFFEENTSVEQNKTEDLITAEKTEPEPKEIAKTTENTEDTNSETLDYFDNYLAEVENEKIAKNKASELLNKQPQKITLRQNERKRIEKGKVAREEIRQKFKKIQEEKLAPEEKVEQLKQEFEPAPLGLYWNTSTQDIKKLGYKLKSVEREDYQNAYLVLNPQQKNNTFAEIIAIFGLQDKLWCIYAQGQLLDDNSKAEKVLALYKKYYKALEQKYGNAKQFFTPYSYEEELISGEGEKQIITKVQKENPLGGDNFLSELQEGKAFLYATFNNKQIGVTLAVSVDGDGKSYITIDYKNLKIMKKEQQAIIDEL